MTERRQETTDALLAVRCQLQEPGAFDELVAVWHPRLWRYVRRLSGDRSGAEDIVQESWLRIVRGIHALREPRRLAPWMFGITRRVAMNRLRDRYATSAREAEGLDLDRIPCEAEVTEPSLDAATLLQRLELLPLAERDVLVLFHLEELSLAQVADATAVPVGTVKSRLFRARRLLQQALTTTEKDK